VNTRTSSRGASHHPKIPDLKGLKDFAGPVFHSARWDAATALSGRRVAVVGTGSSGVQLVDALVGTVDQLLVFQRTAQPVLPLPNWRTGWLTHAIRRHFPVVRRCEHRLVRAVFRWLFSRAAVEPGWRRRLIGWLCRKNLNQVADPELRRRLTPDYAPLCRRIPVSTAFYRAAQHPSVHVVTDPIDHVAPHGIVTADGEHHEVDVIILATGFHAHSYLRPVELVNADGRTLSQAWQPGPHAYRSVAHPDFPNFFMLVGPHSPVATDAITTIAETQADFVLHWIEEWRRNGFTTIAPTHTATERYNRELRAALRNTVWTTGCGGWYLDQRGLPDTWPWRVEHYAAQLEALNPNDFDVR
jgi:cation diffusion facilitator CzcD-associated flavoprotein CzcO